MTIWVKMPGGDRMTIVQALQVATLVEAHAPAHWHMNDCGCCVTVHPDDDCTRGFVVGQDGEFDYLEMGQN